MKNLLQVNELLRLKIAGIIEEEVGIEGAMITVSRVDCADNLSYARVGITVLPESKELSALKTLKGLTSEMRRRLVKEIRMRKIPALRWGIDQTEKRAREIDDILRGLN
jgi:ribosome-binding factor A